HTLAFTVSPQDQVDYNTSLDTFVTGRGTNTIVLDLFAVGVVSHLSVPLTLDGQPLPLAGATLRLGPGVHTLRDPNAVTGGTVDFTVTAGGTVDYNLDPALNGVLSGSGTSTLTVNGRTMALATQAVPFVLQLDQTLTVPYSPNAAFA